MISKKQLTVDIEDSVPEEIEDEQLSTEEQLEWMKDNCYEFEYNKKDPFIAFGDGSFLSLDRNFILENDVFLWYEDEYGKDKLLDLLKNGSDNDILKIMKETDKDPYSVQVDCISELNTPEGIDKVYKWMKEHHYYFEED